MIGDWKILLVSSGKKDDGYETVAADDEMRTIIERSVVAWRAPQSRDRGKILALTRRFNPIMVQDGENQKSHFRCQNTCLSAKQGISGFEKVQKEGYPDYEHACNF